MNTAMMLDCHIHMNETWDSPQVFLDKLKAAGLDGGMVFSQAPASFHNCKAERGDAKRRLDQILDYTKGLDNLYPFFFIDPMEEDAEEQVDRAVEAGIRGFKVICCHHYPQDDRPMAIWERIAGHGKPLLLHSGILYNNGPSADFNRPGNFEALFYVKNLRFAVAHISWPWCDELIAVFGKWNYLYTEKVPGMTAHVCGRHPRHAAHLPAGGPGQADDGGLRDGGA
ncbi:MAG: amidohydrolase family protein [Oscillospiraceae bacterium]